MINRFQCILAHRKMISVWLNNPKNICLRSILKMESLIRGNCRKISSKRKWTYIEYHVQDNDDVAQKDVKMYCDTNQLPALPFCGSQPNSHGARGLGKNYHLRFDPNLGHGICAIFRIPCDCARYTPMLEKFGLMVFCQQIRHATNL